MQYVKVQKSYAEVEYQNKFSGYDILNEGSYTGDSFDESGNWNGKLYYNTENIDEA